MAEPPAKRPRLSPSLVSDAVSSREAELGITEFTNSAAPAFTGILKQRYSDFLVNEISLSGDVIHLQILTAPPKISTSSHQDVQDAAETVWKNQEQEAEISKTDPAEQPNAEIPQEDQDLLNAILSEEVCNSLLELYKSIITSPADKKSWRKPVETQKIDDREVRTKLHQNIKRIFHNKLDTTTNQDGNIIISGRSGANPRIAQSRPSNRGNGTDWKARGGEFLYFTLLKENKDTMEVMSLLSRLLKLPSKLLSFAGTKDRRAVTTQQVCLFRQNADRVASLNKTLRGARVGDFHYRPTKLELGDLNGNQFHITLRDCQFQGLEGPIEESLERATGLLKTAFKSVEETGFINYYGLQRFGNTATGTHGVGLKMLNGDFKGAVDQILSYDQDLLEIDPDIAASRRISTVDIARATALHAFHTGGDKATVQSLPQMFTAETQVIKHLSRKSCENDYLGALQQIPRNLRTMYVHAHQSLIWNHAASERWRAYGSKVITGDLVLIPKDDHSQDHGSDGDLFQDSHQRARALSAEEVESGLYTVFDIVLPSPGYDVLYPSNAIGTFYETFMASERGGGLDPHNMRRKWRDVSLFGAYRKLLGQIEGDTESDVKLYCGDQQLVQTDLDALQGKQLAEMAEGEKKMAVIVKFSLSSSQYATMALRELAKGGIKAYEPEFGKAKIGQAKGV